MPFSCCTTPEMLWPPLCHLKLSSSLSSWGEAIPGLLCHPWGFWTWYFTRLHYWSAVTYLHPCPPLPFSLSRWNWATRAGSGLLGLGCTHVSRAYKSPSQNDAPTGEHWESVVWSCLSGLMQGAAGIHLGPGHMALTISRWAGQLFMVQVYPAPHAVVPTLGNPDS